jgi:hypothetical protein
MSDIGWDPLRFIQEGGAAMYLALCFVLVSHPLALGALGSLFATRRAFPLGMGAATLLFALGTLLVGVLGYVWGMQQVNEALAYVEPEHAEELRRIGTAEADNNLWLGALGALFPFLAGTLAIVRGATLKEKPAGT